MLQCTLLLQQRATQNRFLYSLIIISIFPACYHVAKNEKKFLCLCGAPLQFCMIPITHHHITQLQYYLVYFSRFPWMYSASIIVVISYMCYRAWTHRFWDPQFAGSGKILYYASATVTGKIQNKWGNRNKYELNPLKGGGHIMTTFVMVYLKGRKHSLYTA